ncbi:MAG TPA: hypothetical protein VF545_01280 [Thermoleophilaceae bacterium]
MRRGIGSASAALVVVAALAGAPGTQAGSLPPVRPPAGATSHLLWTKKVSPGVIRYRYRYGPLVAAPGHNLILVGPATIEKPPGDGYMTRVNPDLVDAGGATPPIEQVHMHHALILNLSQPDTTWPSLPQRFYGFAEEKTVVDMPEPYGYPVKASDVWAVNYMLHNETSDSKTVWMQYDLDWVPAQSARGSKMKPVRPLWIDTQNGKPYPVFDVHRGSGGDGRLTYPDEARPDPYGSGPKLNEWRADRAGTLVLTGGHLHPGGLWTDLDVVRGGRRAHVFRSDAKYFDPNGPISWDLAMTTSPETWRVGVKKGDVLRVSTTYETRRANWYESMGLMLAYMSDEANGPDPFAHEVQTTGEITHGHFASANNHGGKPTGLPDARSLPDGATVDNRAAVEDFTYLPGDLSASGAFGAPPVVQPGEALDFGNVDASGGIGHTITACRAPCTSSTGISYPLADGPIEFDSGQLGYGPPGYTAAVNRSNWKTPSNLPGGTYTYFCRVHPFMRGAFRVPGAPPRAPAAASLSIASRRARVDRHGRVRVKLRCAGAGRCAGELKLVRRAKGRTRTVASGRYSMNGGHKRFVRVRLARAARRALRRGHRVRLTATATGGGTAVTRRVLVLPARHRRR